MDAAPFISWNVTEWWVQVCFFQFCPMCTTCKLKGKNVALLFVLFRLSFFARFPTDFYFHFICSMTLHSVWLVPFFVFNAHCNNKSARWFNGKWRQRTAILQHQQSKTTFTIKLIDFCLNQWLWKHSKMNGNYDSSIRNSLIPIPRDALSTDTFFLFSISRKNVSAWTWHLLDFEICEHVWSCVNILDIATNQMTQSRCVSWNCIPASKWCVVFIGKCY